ncbi:hypothetical protein D3C71_1063430 [compost metagenome]
MAGTTKTINEQQRIIDDLADALRDLHALVWGECPSLLNEDSGGNSALDMQIRDALEAAKATREA